MGADGVRTDYDVAVVIPTLNREAELATCVESLTDASLSIQWIILRERGALARLRNRGLQRARAPVTLFCDDDIVAAPGYLQRMLLSLDQLGAVGLTGPSLIPDRYQRNRYLYQSRSRLRWYEHLFVKPEVRPGHLTPAGTFVPLPDWTYSGSVQFLEACHMAFKTDAIKAIGGFDEVYGGVGDWSEPDVCFRLRTRYGAECLWFDPQCTVEHRCSPGGATVLRDADARQRLRNYHIFAQRWVASTPRHRLYRAFLLFYYRVYTPWRRLLTT